MKNKKLIVIVGPTAIGKTACAIQLGKHFGAEIISADARQFFKETEIGTAKPSLVELQSVPHHFINSHSIQDFFSTGDFEVLTLEKLNQLFQEHDIAIMVGGSGLYINAVCNGLDDLPEIKLEVRTQLTQEVTEKGLPYLQEQLALHDPITYEKIDRNNTQRVIRALEVFYTTGTPLSAFQTGRAKERDFEIIKIGLNTDRAQLYAQINQRVDQMMDAGLLKEAELLYPFKHLNALKTVGYTELFDYFDGHTDLATAVEKIKQNTRRFAKRQITWFKKDTQTTWFEPSAYAEILSFIQTQL